MSHGRHNASSEIAHLVADVKNLTPEQALDEYGIEIFQDRTIYDQTYEETFKNIHEWAKYVVEQENDEWDDEYDKHNSKWDEEE